MFLKNIIRTEIFQGLGIRDKVIFHEQMYRNLGRSRGFELNGICMFTLQGNDVENTFKNNVGGGVLMTTKNKKKSELVNKK